MRKLIFYTFFIILFLSKLYAIDRENVINPLTGDFDLILSSSSIVTNTVWTRTGSTIAPTNVGDNVLIGTGTFTAYNITDGTITINDGMLLNGITVESDIGNFNQVYTSSIIAESPIYMILGNNSGDDFKINGSTFVVEGDTGWVGIGNPFPAAKLDVRNGEIWELYDGANPRFIIGDTTAAGDFGFLQWDSASNYFRIETVGSNGLKVTDGGFAIGNLFPDSGAVAKFGEGSTELVRISTAGAMGINTQTPTELLEVEDGNIKTNWGINAATATFSGLVTISSLTVTNQINANDLIVSSITAADANGLSLFDDAYNLGLFLEDGGYVGVGTDNPSNPLHVYQQSTLPFVSERNSSSTSSILRSAEFHRTTTGTSANGLGTEFALRGDDDGGNLETMLTFGAYFTDVSAAGEESAMRIELASDSSLFTAITMEALTGDKVLMGINKESPTETLDVNGSIKTNYGINAATGVFSGDVFISSIVANSATGISIYDDSDNLGIVINDGGEVSIGTTTTTGASLSVLESINIVDTSDAIISMQDVNGSTGVYLNSGGLSYFKNPVAFSVNTSTDILYSTNTVSAITDYRIVESSGGAVTLTSNPQISAGTSIDGTVQTITLVGDSDTNTITVVDGNGLVLNSGTSFTLGLYDIISFIYIKEIGLWIEVYRSDN